MKYFLTISLVLLLSLPFKTIAQDSNQKKEVYVSFTLRNGSLKSIPLLIPSVMNPNLSPMGNSGVTLKVGQEILFKYKSKKRVLLVVDESLEGQTLEVQKVLKIRKEEIDSKSKN